LEIDQINFSEKEKRLFALAVKAHADPYSVTDDEFAQLREAGVTDSELVETIEVVNLGDGINRFCDTLGIGPDAFLTYEMPG